MALRGFGRYNIIILQNSLAQYVTYKKMHHVRGSMVLVNKQYRDRFPGRTRADTCVRNVFERLPKQSRVRQTHAHGTARLPAL